MGLEVKTDREYIQNTIIPYLQQMMVADWDNFEDPRLSAEDMYTKVLEYLNPPNRGCEARPVPLGRGCKKFSWNSSRIPLDNADKYDILVEKEDEYGCCVQ